MNDDTRLRVLFDGYAPSLSEEEQFVGRLERKLALIDGIKQAQAAQLRRYRLAVAAAFAAGVIVGAGLLFFTLAIPSDVPLFTFGINFYPLLLIEQNSRLVVSLIASLMIALSIVALMNAGELATRRGIKTI